MGSSHDLLLLLMFLHYAVGPTNSCVKILPDSSSNIVLEVGKDFTATCHLLEGSAYTSDDIEWSLGNVSIAKQSYRKINETSVSVTVNINSNMSGWLRCRAAKKSLSYAQTCIYGILLRTGYPPLKPKNLSCIAVQEDKDISSYLNCSWDPGSRNPLIVATYTVYANVLGTVQTYKADCNQHLARSCVVNLETFPIHMVLKVWVEVKNALGSERSEELQTDSSYFAKPNPPLNVQVLTEVNIPTCLMVTWKHPIDRTILKLSYAIEYRKAASDVWIEVPESFTRGYIESFRLQSLEPYTQYVVQMRCIGESYSSYWSNWSHSITESTAEAKPASAPDLWRIIQPTSNNRKVSLIWKAPVKANGKILLYNLSINQDNEMFESHNITADNLRQMYSMELPTGKMASIEITAVNSVGVSPKATLFIPRSDKELPGVEDMSWSVCDEKPEPELQVKWTAVLPLHHTLHLSEYLLEWVKIPQAVHQTELQADWQRVPNNVTITTLNADLEKFKRYNISVYPIYKYYSGHMWHFLAGRPVTRPAYIQQGTPEEGPTVTVTKSKKNSAELTWKEIPLDRQRGFITNYTIFYEIGNTKQWKSVTVGPNVHTHVLTDLASETDYVVNVVASTEAGSVKGTGCTFKTMKYGDGEVEVIVVVVCLSFLFLTVFIIMLCLRKREVLKKLLWPQVPDPSDSSIAHWSPDFPIKADLPKEDVSVVEVDVFDGKSLCEEDKGVLPLKKDKYLSEEHSSGIGGSSCMSSPRHSVSDSDEGDSGQTTASTVQYSSVRASGYKGQTPSHQPPTFARSESTQPLLDCEEHPDHLNESHSRSSYFRRGRELEPGVLAPECDGGSLTFCPVQEEEASPVAEDPPASALCYMPQKSGYRPQ
ncbi:interleukin-6 receptor subunit beta-like [Sinocyclocheilus rhinocerous]|uniref:Interleukin-6 receptor subunit beta-like n=1 Tax=Sinocyclocheilus rhinocerous TaxID=307959 RepID=A0A673IJZ7_9TELE|nr:PREDICTED: interleukin-6 receptor subunit beta-like [Sinocyclocheilus rhinocerous]